MATVAHLNSDFHVGDIVGLRDSTLSSEYSQHANQLGEIVEVHGGGIYSSLQFRVFIQWADGTISAAQERNLFLAMRSTLNGVVVNPRQAFSTTPSEESRDRIRQGYSNLEVSRPLKELIEEEATKKGKPLNDFWEFIK